MPIYAASVPLSNIMARMSGFATPLAAFGVFAAWWRLGSIEHDSFHNIVLCPLLRDIYIGARMPEYILNPSTFQARISRRMPFPTPKNKGGLSVYMPDSYSHIRNNPCIRNVAVSEPTEISVKNFKSLRDFRTTLDGFNVLIGPNGSGKTNVLELFKFANLCIDPLRVPAYPFAAWSGFGNIVWRHDEGLPISIQASHTVAGHRVEYVAELAGSSGKLEYLGEKLFISDYITLARSMSDVEIILDSKFRGRIQSDLDANLGLGKSRRTRILVQPQIFKIQTQISILRYLHQYSPTISLENILRIMRDVGKSSQEYSDIKDIGVFRWLEEEWDQMIYVPTIQISNKRQSEQYLHQHAVDFFVGSESVILLRQLNYSALRKAPQVEQRAQLKEDGSGLVGILFRWYNTRRGLPDRFSAALEALFPKWQISFTVTDDGRILLNAHDGNTDLRPPSIPDGFYKMLVILAAVELNPKFLLIDEIEASLHAEMIEYIMEELRACDSKVITTTHSPAVIDAVKLEELTLLERTGAGTTCRRIEDPAALKERLNGLGITVSEGWLYGKI